MTTAAALVIGNELLSGKTADTNTPFLAAELRRAGVQLRRVSMVRDETAEIVAGLTPLMAAFTYVFTSGGVGPTHDDITMAAVATALGRRLVREPTLEARIRAHFDVARLPDALRMADVPEGSRLVAGEGLWIPVLQVENVFILPGLPSVFRRKVTALVATLKGSPRHLRLLFLEVDEVAVAGLLRTVAAAHPEVEIGSYPEPEAPGHRLKVTFEGATAAVDQALAAVEAGLASDIVRRVE